MLTVREKNLEAALRIYFIRCFIFRGSCAGAKKTKEKQTARAGCNCFKYPCKHNNYILLRGKLSKCSKLNLHNSSVQTFLCFVSLCRADKSLLECNKTVCTVMHLSGMQSQSDAMQIIKCIADRHCQSQPLLSIPVVNTLLFPRCFLYSI